MAVHARHAFLPAMLLSIAAPPAGADDAKTALRLEARLRHEQVEDAGFAHRAVADTLRLRVGLDLHWDDRWQALVEAEGVAAADSRHDSGANGGGSFPAVIDPTGIELNQAWLSWSHARFGWILGRQRLQLDNQRWIGNSGWRQNEQTFDAATLSWTPPATAASLRLVRVERVHRVAGDRARDRLARERDLDTWLFNAAFGHAAGRWVAYAYRHRDQDVPAASTLTTGLRGSGRHARDWGAWGWTLEAARQRDAPGNPSRFAHSYWLVEPSLATGAVAWRLGWEHLGGDGIRAVQAPLGTLHAFNGWADRFNATPATGLDDRYLAVGGEPDGHAWSLAWHDYRPDHGGGRLGREWNASWGFPVHGRTRGLLKFADFEGRGGIGDVRKLWLQLEWSSP
ncbi:MAG: alginate export family protein [Gammaproteobacteria bacterium]